MKRTLTLLLLSSLAALAQPSGYVQSSASGTTSATIYLEPGVRAAPIAAVDVTSDKAASVLSFQAGTGARYTALATAYGTNKQIVVTGTGAASNDLLLAVSGSSVWPLIVTNSTSTTNVTLVLENPLGTNVAVGSTVREVTTSGYSTLIAATPATTNQYFPDTVDNWSANDVALLWSSNRWSTNVISAASSNIVLRLALTRPVQDDTYYGHSVRELGTNTAVLLAAATSSDTSLNVDATNGFVANANVLVQRGNGALFYATISSVGTTNITLSAAVSELSIGDSIITLTTNLYPVRLPAMAGANILCVASNTGLAASDQLVVMSPGRTWYTSIASVTTSTVPLITMSTANAGTIAEGARLYHLTTNLYGASLAAAAADNWITLTNASGLTNADTVLISPSTGGHVVRQIGVYSNFIYQVVGTTTNNATLTAGDYLCTVRQTNTTPVGATTLRTSPPWVIPQRAPARIVLDGTSACSINSVLVNYGN